MSKYDLTTKQKRFLDKACYLTVMVWVLLFVLASPVHALPAMGPIDGNSPLFPEFVHMQKIYDGACVEASHGDNWDETMPMFENDRLVNIARRNYPRISNFDTHTLVYAGYELGRALNLTDLSGNYTDDICKRYSLNFAATIVNGAAKRAGSDALPPPSVTTFDMPNPFNDWLSGKEIGLVHLTPRVAYQSACGYMYSVYARGPVIEVNALDATLDMMQDMLFHTYNREDIRGVYPYLLQGAKMGRVLFSLKQDVRLCYD